MNPHFSTFPSYAEGLTLHLRLLAQEPEAAADLCQGYLDPLLAGLAGRFPLEDPHLRASAAHDALIDYLKHPERYDPSRADLGAYLRLAARRDLANLRRGEARHHRMRVEVGADGGNIPGREEDPAWLAEREEEAARCREYLKAVAAGLSQADARVLDLMLAGEQANGLFAAVLGATALPRDEQDREVKRAKDRVRKRLERGGWHDE